MGSEAESLTTGTYRQLDSVLKTLGFSRIEGEGATVYRQIAKDVVIVLPRVDPQEEIEPRHWIAVRNALEAKAIAPAGIFADLMSDAVKAASATPAPSD